MTLHPFVLESEESLIVLPSLLDDEEISLVLDTGASHTIVDLTKLLIAGYSMSDALGMVDFETGKGVVSAYVFEIKRLEALGIVREKVTVCSYDFMGNDVLTEMDGVLGLDFLRGTDLWISFKRFLISLEA